MRKTILIFGAVSIILLVLFELSKYTILNLENSSSNFFVVLSGAVFILVGFYIHRILYSKPKINSSRSYKDSKLSKQEHRVLCLMNDGLSNAEIANHLFIAESTVKKHVSNILSKLKAKRRTEAVKIGRDLEII